MSTTAAPTANRQGRATSVTVEAQILSELRRRWRRVRGLVRATIGYQNDALNLRANAEERDSFDFPTDSGKIEAFVRWLRAALREEVLEPLPRGQVTNGEHWTAPYIRSAVVRGANQATGLLLQRGVSIENVPDDELLNRPIYEQTLRDLYTRTYDELEGLVEEDKQSIRETLTTSFARGWNPRKTANALTEELRELQRARAEVIARTEIIHAHSESTRKTYERAGVGVVSHGEWQATQDTRTCPFCRRLSGAELTLDEMATGVVEWRGQVYRLQPPSHPNGRCVILPSIGGEPPTSPLASRVPGTVIAGA